MAQMDLICSKCVQKWTVNNIMMKVNSKVMAIGIYKAANLFLRVYTGMQNKPYFNRLVFDLSDSVLCGIL
jgi:hypothetical protein